MISPNRILIIRFSSLGDIILLTPLFRELRRIFPDSRIDFLTSTTFAGICANNPHINRIITIDRQQGTKDLDSFIREYSVSDYGLIIDAHRSLRSRLLMVKWMGLFNGFSRKTSYIDKRSFRRNLLLATGINLMKNAISQREAYLDLIPERFVGESLEPHTELYPSTEDRRVVEKLLKEKGMSGQRLVALGPGASFAGKCWPKEKFLELSEKLQQAGNRVILLGVEKEVEPVWITENSRIAPLNLAGRLSYLETAALLERCAMVVSNDTAVVHFAEAMGIPAIAIFGPTSVEFGYGPFLERSRIMEVDLKCRPCSRNGKGSCRNRIQRQCLVDIGVESVLEASLQTLG